MLAAMPWPRAANLPVGVTVFVPLPFEVICLLKERPYPIEQCKNEYMTAVQYSGRMPYGMPHYKLAAIFMQFVIFQDYYMPWTHHVINQCLDLTSYSKEINILNLGVEESQVYVHVAGIQIVLVDLQEATTRPDLFPAIQALEKVAKRGFLPPKQSLQTCFNGFLPTLANKPLNTNVSKLSLTSPSNPNTKQQRPKGAKCQHILNGQCGFFHIKQEITEAGGLVEEFVAISPCKVEWLGGTHGVLLQVMAQQCGCDISLEPEERNKMRILRLAGTRGAVNKGVELIMERTGSYSEDVERSKASEDKRRANDIAEPATDVSVSKVEVNGTKVESVTSATTQSDSVSAAPKVKANESAMLPYCAAVTNTGRSTNLQADLKDDAAWPSLKPQASFDAQRSSSKPALPYAAKAAMPPRVQTKFKAVLPKKQGMSKRRVTKVNYKHPCIHGKNCQYIMSGRDECKYFHSTQEIEQAAARFSNAKVHISPTVVAWVIGKGGSRLKQMEKESGATMFVDQESRGTNENRIIHITGKPKCVNAAVAILKKMVPETHVAGSELGNPSGKVPDTLADSIAKNAAMVEEEMYLSPDVVARVVGKNGSKMNRVSEESQANILVAPKGSGSVNENRLVRITGTQASVDTATEMIKELLPDDLDDSDFDPSTEKRASAETKDAAVGKENTVATNADAPDAVDSGTIAKHASQSEEKSTRNEKSAPAAKAAHAGKNKPCKVQKLLYVSPAVVGWIIGKEGKALKERIREGGTEMHVDSDSMRLNENKIVYLTGTEMSIESAIAMVKKQLPDGDEFEDGPGVPSINGISHNHSVPNSTTHPVTPTPTVDVTSPPNLTPSLHPGILMGTTLLSPPRPIRQLPTAQPVHDFAALLPSDTTSVYSGSGNLLSDTSKSGSSFAADYSCVTGKTISTQPSSSSSSLLLSASSYGMSGFEALESVPPISCADPLLLFLYKQAECLKGSPEAFHAWLLMEDITSLTDLAEAVADDDYLNNVMKQGDGTIGIKGFKRNAFKKAVAEYFATF